MEYDATTLAADEFIVKIGFNNSEVTEADSVSIELTHGEHVQVLATPDKLVVFSGYLLDYLATINPTHFDTLDSEILQQWLAQAEGYFSLLLLDKHTGTLFLARDKLGCKVLYYAQGGESIVVSNRLKLMPKHRGQTFDPKGLQESIYYRWLSGPQTLLNQVSQVPAASYIELDKNQISHHRYIDWHQINLTQTAKPLAKIVTELDDAFDHYYSRIASQVNRVLIPLSGGVDSSVLAAKAVQHLGDKVVLGLVEFEGFENPELPMAQYFANQLGVETHTIHYTAQEFATDYSQLSVTLEQLPRHYSSLPFAKLLNFGEFDAVIYGEPGDTFFGSSTIKRLMKRFKRKRLAGMIPERATKLLSWVVDHPVSSKLRKLQTETVAEIFHHADRLVFSNAADKAVLNQLASIMRSTDFIDEVIDLPDDNQFLRLLAAEQLAYLKNYMMVTDIVDHMLTAEHLIANKNMAILTPMTCNRVLSVLSQISPADYLGVSHVKVVLRELGCRFYSRSSMYAPKYGFTMPVEEWVEEIRTEMADALSTGKLVKAGLLPSMDLNRAQSLSREMLWTLYHLEKFSQHFLVD